MSYSGVGVRFRPCNLSDLAGQDFYETGSQTLPVNFPLRFPTLPISPCDAFSKRSLPLQFMLPLLVAMMSPPRPRQLCKTGTQEQSTKYSP